MRRYFFPLRQKPITRRVSEACHPVLAITFLLPRPWDVGIALYWTLCFVWGGVIGVLAASVESMILLATRRILPVKPVHMTMHGVLAMAAFFLGACCHGGLPR